MKNKLVIMSVGNGKEHLYADTYQVDTRNRLYLNGQYLAWYDQTDPENINYTEGMTYTAFCDMIDGLKMALPGLMVTEIHVDESELPESWLAEHLEKYIGIGTPTRKYRATVTRTGYSHASFEVEASSEEEARERALQEACNLLFSEKDAEYDVESISEV